MKRGREDQHHAGSYGIDPKIAMEMRGISNLPEETIEERIKLIKLRKSAAVAAQLKGMSSCVYVGNITDSCDEDALNSMFPFAQQYERFSSFALVHFESPEIALEYVDDGHRQISFQNRNLVLRVIKVEELKWMESLRQHHRSETARGRRPRPPESGAGPDRRYSDLEKKFVDFFKVNLKRDPPGFVDSLIPDFKSPNPKPPEIKHHCRFMHVKTEYERTMDAIQAREKAMELAKRHPRLIDVEGTRKHLYSEEYMKAELALTGKDPPVMYLGIGRTKEEARYEAMSHFFVYGPPATFRANRNF
jgi:hypothetical protein